MSKDHKKYWQANLKVVGGLLTLWFVVSFLMAIVFREPLDSIKLGGFGLGFWMAQQGSIYFFVAIIWYYVWKMNRIDHSFDVDE